MSKPILYMMLGYPGAGKTTIAEHIAASTGAIHLNSDRFRLHMLKQPQFTPEEHDFIYNALDYLTELLLAGGVSVIYDANLNHYVHRSDKYVICERTGAQARLIWVKTNPELARQRATEKADDDPKRPFGNMKSEMFERLVHTIEPPHDDEPVTAVPGADITPENVRRILGI